MSRLQLEALATANLPEKYNFVRQRVHRRMEMDEGYYILGGGGDLRFL